MGSVTNYPTRMWAYQTPQGQLIASSIRGRSGDSDAALEKGWCGKKYGIKECQKIRIIIDIEI